ncbi:hypothetical protein EIP91_010998 [Steccherinum ochraceum]|uniref:Uncharacterized protein n=1 Tax=Steccherinum ochraceum TaxID=92696 RepID=A0A4R0RIE6_9APHY|nr:hypothetical protein EIP91_010998 [Steccherinum ochraceum]
MPRASKNAFSCIPPNATRRRMTGAERRKASRDALGLPGPVDLWLAKAKETRIGEGGSVLSSSASGSEVPGVGDEDTVKCCVEMECTPGEIEGPFVDSPTYTLYLTLTASSQHTTGVPGSYVVFPRIILETYEGWPTSHDAPDWLYASQLAARCWKKGKGKGRQETKEREVRFSQTREEVMAFLLSVAPKKDSEVDVLAKGIQSIRI